MLIALVGLPGGGKSTIGRHLAKRIGVDFIDSDIVIENRLGDSIRRFFEREGEERFREIEQDVLVELVSSREGVLATGGGVVVREANRSALQTYATVVYLHSSPEELIRRLRRDTQRPLLQVNDPLSRLRELHAQRDPLYREIAHFTVETGKPSVSALVSMITMQLELAGIVRSNPPKPKADAGA